MPPNEAADLLAALPSPHSDLLLEKMERDEAAEVQQLLRYDPDTAGGMMTTEFVTLPRVECWTKRARCGTREVT